MAIKAQDVVSVLRLFHILSEEYSSVDWLNVSIIMCPYQVENCIIRIPLFSETLHWSDSLEIRTEEIQLRKYTDGSDGFLMIGYGPLSNKLAVMDIPSDV